MSLDFHKVFIGSLILGLGLNPSHANQQKSTADFWNLPSTAEQPLNLSEKKTKMIEIDAIAELANEIHGLPTDASHRVNAVIGEIKTYLAEEKDDGLDEVVDLIGEVDDAIHELNMALNRPETANAQAQVAKLISLFLEARQVLEKTEMGAVSPITNTGQRPMSAAPDGDKHPHRHSPVLMG